MEKFRMDNGRVIEDLATYCIDYVKNNPDVMIVVGCDSSNQRKKTSYATVICFRHPYKGIHRISSIVRVKKIRDIFTRLWKEVEYAAEIAEYLESILNNYFFRWTKFFLADELGKVNEEDISEELLLKYNEKTKFEKKVSIHVDLSKDKKFKSNRVYDAGIGYLIGMNYRVKSKPQAWAASCAADCIVKMS